MLIKPLITEKSLKDAGKKRYTFAVKKEANKPQISQAVEKTFGVKVIEVHTSNMPGKKYRSGKRWVYRYKPNWKKAIVTIKSDQKIELFEAAGSIATTPEATK